MWPWEHLVFGYVIYSGFVRARYRRLPAERPVLVLAFMTQFPDLVDKPLAWTFGVLPSGTSLAHSLLFVLLVLIVTVLLSARFETPDVPPAVAIGYLSHLLGDVLYPVFLGGGISAQYLLWPIVSQSPDPATTFLFEFQRFLTLFLEFLATPRGAVYLVLEVVVVTLAVALWIRDGCPGLAFARRVITNRPTTD